MKNLVKENWKLKNDFGLAKVYKIYTKRVTSKGPVIICGNIFEAKDNCLAMISVKASNYYNATINEECADCNFDEAVSWSNTTFKRFVEEYLSTNIK